MPPNVPAEILGKLSSSSCIKMIDIRKIGKHIRAVTNRGCILRMWRMLFIPTTSPALP